MCLREFVIKQYFIFYCFIPTLSCSILKEYYNELFYYGKFIILYVCVCIMFKNLQEIYRGELANKNKSNLPFLF